MRRDQNQPERGGQRTQQASAANTERPTFAAFPEPLSWQPEAAIIEIPRRPLRPDRSVSVVTDRVAVALVQHEPGWRLPRLSVLARQYDTTSEVLAAAIGELADRGLIRRMPDGRFCRASPAHYVLPFASNGHGLRVLAESLGGELSVKSRSVSVHSVRDDIERALQITSDEPAWIVQLLWAVSGEPAAITATYVAPQWAESLIPDEHGEPHATCGVLHLTPLAPDDGQDAAGQSWLVPRALHTEMQQPPRWAAQALGLTAWQRAFLITTRYDDARVGKPVALTAAALRTDLFRITITSSDQPILATDAGEVSSAWSHVAGDSD